MRYEVLNANDKKSFDKHQLGLVSDKIFLTTRTEVHQEGIEVSRVMGEEIGVIKGKHQKSIELIP
jgi:hypothetical protein